VDVGLLKLVCNFSFVDWLVIRDTIPPVSMVILSVQSDNILILSGVVIILDHLRVPLVDREHDQWFA
jgi:hypothetical protein